MSAIAGATERTVTVRPGVDLRLYEAGLDNVAADGSPAPLVILSHGFPELAYSWRHQIPALAAAGYRVVAPDQRGYGGSVLPEPIDAYGIGDLTDDLLAVADLHGADQAIYVGHDWGAMVVWQMAVLHPERVTGVVGMSVPFVPRGPMPPVEMMRAVFEDQFFYIVYFQDPGVADAELGSDAARTMRRMLCGARVDPNADVSAMSMAADAGGFVDRMPETEGLPDWLSQAELDFYSAEFARTGFTGGINWYRNMDANWRATPQLDGVHVTMPSLYVGGSADPVVLMSPPGISDGYLDDHRGNVMVEGAGHWVQQEDPEATNAALLEFLSSL